MINFKNYFCNIFYLPVCKQAHYIVLTPQRGNCLTRKQGLKPRPKHFDAAVIYESSKKTCERGNMPRAVGNLIKNNRCGR